ncbi:MAG: DUF4230 domain-containing protein [Bacteroidales bacterium]|nr:DUF4230 domain-containing protein [Bacteroidales bacterium]
MKTLKERFFMEAPQDAQQTKAPRVNAKKASSGLTRKQFTLGSLAISAVLLCLCVYWIMDTFAVGTGAAMHSFGAAKDEAADEAYQFFYDMSYSAAEEAHHVSNNVSITIGDLKEEQKLEVLKVSDVAYETPEPTDQGWFDSLITSITGIFDADVVSWLEVPGNGVFTVNLQAGEFIIDEERQYVLIRVPNPELTEFTIDYKNVELLLFEAGGAFKNSAKYGADKAMEQLQSAELTMRQNVNNDQEFYKRARESTEKMLVNLVRQLNPQLPELVVDVEFIN